MQYDEQNRYVIGNAMQFILTTLRNGYEVISKKRDCFSWRSFNDKWKR